MPRRVGVRSHRFMKVVLLLAVLLVILLLHRQVVLLLLLLAEHLHVTGVGLARRPLFSPGENSGYPRPRL